MSEASQPSATAPPDWDTYVRQHPDQVVKLGLLGSVLDTLMEIMKTMIADRKALAARVADLELSIGTPQSEAMKTLLLRVSNLENRTVKADFVGVWQDGVLYPKNTVVIRGGSSWTASIDKPSGMPGTAGSGWVLSQKGER